MPNSSEAIRAAAVFEFYVRRIWPAHRIFVKNRISKRCSKCAASEKMVPLGSDGMCRLCREWTGAPPRKDTGAATLDQILKDHQGRGVRRYDALVAYSGGKDSSYLIKRIQRDFPGLRMLAFTIDNGFMSPVAKENIDELIPKLGVDHIFVRPRKEFYLKLFRYCLTHLNEEGGYGTVDFSDGEFMLDTARRVAAESRIPLILCGYSRYQVENGLRLTSFESPRSKELSDRKETAGIPLSAIFSGNDIAQWWHGSQWPSEAVARLLFPLYAWDLEESEILKQVTKWGLLSSRSQSPIVTNHQLIPLLGVVDVHQRGYSSFEIEFCRMVREGKADQRAWQPVFELLEYTAQTGLFLKPAILASLAQLDLSLEDVGIRFSG